MGVLRSTRFRVPYSRYHFPDSIVAHYATGTRRCGWYSYSRYTYTCWCLLYSLGLTERAVTFEIFAPRSQSRSAGSNISDLCSVLYYYFVFLKAQAINTYLRIVTESTNQRLFRSTQQLLLDFEHAFKPIVVARRCRMCRCAGHNERICSSALQDAS